MRSLVAGVMICTGFVLAPGAVAQAPPSISVSPTTEKPGNTVTVTGTSGCASVAYTVSFQYTDPAGLQATTTATGTTDAAGEYTQAMTVPSDAAARQPASIEASVECTGGAQTSNSVPITIAAHAGTLTVTPAAGRPGTSVALAGTNCWGGRVDVVFTDGAGFMDPIAAVLQPDQTFNAAYSIPAGRPPGPHEFRATCPGTDFNAAPFVVEAVPAPPPGPPAPPPAPPASPPPPPPGPSEPVLHLTRGTIVYGDRVRLSGRIGSLPGVEIVIEAAPETPTARRAQTGFRPIKRLVTGGEGGFEVAFVVGSSRRFRFVGPDGTTNEQTVLVRPQIAARLSPARGGMRTLSARVTPMKRRAIIRVESATGRLVERRVVRTRRGRVALRVPAARGHRVRVLTRADRRHAAGRSGVLALGR